MEPTRSKLERALKRRRHSAKQLIERPVTLETCSGPVVVQVTEQGAKIAVEILHPDGLPVTQPPPKLTPAPPTR